MFTATNAREMLRSLNDAPKRRLIIDTALREHTSAGFKTWIDIGVGSDKILAETLRNEYQLAGWQVDMRDVGPDRAHQCYEDWMLRFTLPTAKEAL